jgi:hypothetical protein
MEFMDPMQIRDKAAIRNAHRLPAVREIDQAREQMNAAFNALPGRH